MGYGECVVKQYYRLFCYSLILLTCRSAGCILYELAALKRPFDGLTLMDLMHKITEVDRPVWPAAYSDELAQLFAW